MTTDESPPLDEARLRQLQEEETKVNCPDEYNLLSTNSAEILESVDLLHNTNSAESTNKNQAT